jgi:hypothetical protein
VSETVEFGAAVAKLCIEHVLKIDIEPVYQRGQPGIPDLLFKYGDRKVVVEVKRSIDPAYASFSDASSSRGYTRDPRLTKCWMVWLEWQGNIKRAGADLVNLFLDLESLRVWRVNRDTLCNVDAGLYASAKRMKVRSVASVNPMIKHPPGFYVVAAAWGGFPPSTALLGEFAETWLRGNKAAHLREQLSRDEIPADERHAFLVVCSTDLAHIPLTSDADGELPNVTPLLPEPIDAVWLVSDQHDARIVAWLPQTGWLEMPAPWRPSRV